jgi:hypothetical protein
MGSSAGGAFSQRQHLKRKSLLLSIDCAVQPELKPALALAARVQALEKHASFGTRDAWLSGKMSKGLHSSNILPK